jgi:tRNA pseudouridine38-40 synthase
MNALLPADVAVRNPREMPADFDARHSARARSYRYAVWNAPVRSPIYARYTCHWRGELDATAMAGALSPLIGTRDLAAFSGPIAPDKRAGVAGEPPTVRRIDEIEWRRRGNLVTMEITANGFLPHMVRNVMGAALWVGSGRIAGGTIAGLLESKDRRLAPPPAPACGLCLVRVKYDLAGFGDAGQESGAGWPGDNEATRDYNVHSGLHSEADGPIPDLIR